jgi:two-component system probable response regulator PhcQ
MSEPTPYNKYTILYVDDEEQALKYFQKGLGKEFQIQIATTVAAALEILARDADKIGVVVTDQRMPIQCGTELLKAVHARWPNIVRILTTAYSEVDIAIEAVNGGQIFKYLTKPVDFQLMRETLKAAMDRFLSQGERDSLLQIKLSSLRRMVVADRIQSFANLAYGLTQHLRNAMTATSCFLEEADPFANAQSAAQPLSPDADKYAKQLWKLAADEHDRLIKMLADVEKSVVEHTCQFGAEMAAEQLIAQAAEAAGKDIGPRKISVDVAAGLGNLKVDANKVVQLIGILVNYVARHCAGEGNLTLAAKSVVPLWNTTALQITVSAEGTPWSEKDVATCFTPFAFPKNDPSELGLGLLKAFSIAHDHGGDLLVHRAAPMGPGFELLLPMNPAEVKRPDLQENLLQTIFK